MKRIVLLAIAIVAVANLQAAELREEVVCDAWTRNAVMGAMHAYRGHRRQLMPVTVAQLKDLLTHGQLYSVDGIPVLADEYETDSGKAFLEDSVFYGFDYMQRLPNEQLQQFLANP